MRSIRLNTAAITKAAVIKATACIRMVSPAPMQAKDGTQSVKTMSLVALDIGIIK